MFGLSELAVLLIVVIAVLAAKKLPGLARSAGRSARILKAEARAEREEQPPAGRRVIRGETVPPATTGTDRARPPGDERPH
ncbi:twin-arginine translocase TatA/TatE family subunit [Streptomyces sp. SCL15-4]|uniref:twin-arginine translocase TatA/TatE family subunit n=1 Tax=Streptomyces sp. SCL15-4 TaxID=2967221 RepID=UPI0029664CF0|nr:twin-arginine translocase TatA/TatE family subunit [Streptomyces sp. SCL15-4]